MTATLANFQPEIIVQGGIKDWDVFDLEQALTMDFPEPRWIVESLVPEGTLIGVSGLPHVGKTLDWLAAGLEAVTTHKVWGHFDASNVKRWLYIETEDPRSRVVQRIRDLSKGLGIDPKGKVPEGFYWARTGPFELVKSEEKLREVLTQVRPDVMVLSTLQGLLGKRSMKEQADMAEVNAMLVRLASEFCPIIVITHSPRNLKARRPFGTVMQDANFGVLIHFERLTKGGREVIHARVDEKYEHGNFDFTLQLESEDVTTGKKTSKRPRRVKVLCEGLPTEFAEIKLRDAIAANPEASVRKLAQETGMDKSKVNRILKGKKKVRLPKRR